MNKITKQCVAAVASLAMAGTLCVAGAVVAGSSAWAEDACNNGAPWSDACKTQTGSIEITKYKDELEKNREGKYVQSKKTKVEGAKFKVTPVNGFGSTTIDLKKYEDWLKVAAKVPTLNANPSDTSGITFGTAISDNSNTDTDKTLFTTGSDGKVTIGNLPIGLYKVEETKAAPGYAVLSKPFFMTIPQVTREKSNKDNTYTYKVSVEPKNKSTENAIQKSADTTSMVGAGDEIPYTISTDVTTTSETSPENYTKEDLQGFAVWDDALTNAYDGVTSDLTDANAKKLVTEVKIGETTITNTGEQEDKYKVSVEKYDASKANGLESGRVRIKVTFTDGDDGGLAAIATALKNATDKANLPKLTVKLVFKLAPNAPAGADGFYNKYGYQPGHGKNGTTPEPVNPPNPDPNTKVTLVKFQIKKVNAVKETEGLKDAKFAVFAKKTDADACAADNKRQDANCKNKATKGYTTGTTVADGLAGATKGTAETTGLTGAFEVKVGQKFYVVETDAPEGYALSPKVEEVTAQTSGSDYDAATSTFTYTFKDLPNGGPDGGDNWFKLPATGAAGVIIFALIGLGLVGSGMFVFLKNRKKEEEQAA